MENRYLYRGKRSNNGEWVEWNMLTGIPHDVHILDNTICQCTGPEDKNNKLIFENDIVIKHNDDDKEPYLIRWSENYAAWELTQCGCAMYGFFDVDLGEIEVIGNAIDNPELLEV